MPTFQNANNTDARDAIFNDIAGNQVNNNINIHTNIAPNLESLLSNLVVHDAEYNSRGPAPNCLPGTREAVIARIENWADNRNGPLICWLNGPAGYGKSAIAQTVAERWDARKELAASFFFFRGAGRRSKISHFIPSLAYQLSISVPATRRLIEKALRDDSAILQRSLRRQFDKLVLLPISSIPGSISAYTKPMLVVIDALDECDDKELVAELLDLLTCVDRRVPLRFFLTSRVEEHIRQKCASAIASSKIYSLHLSDFDASPDIRRFFESEFSKIYVENRDRSMRGVRLPWPSPSVLEEFVEKSSESFIFASTLVNVIKTGGGRPEQKLEEAREFHSGLDTLYSQVLSTAPHDPDFGRIFGTIMLLRRPIPITDLAGLLKLEPGHLLYTLRGVEPILLIPGQDDQPIRLLHTSLRDFLVEKGRSGDYYITPSTHHYFIAIDCLNAIGVCSREVFASGVGEYACLNWLDHLHDALTMEGDHRFDYGSLTNSLQIAMAQSFTLWVNTTILHRHEENVERIFASTISVMTQLPNSSKTLVIVLRNIQGKWLVCSLTAS